MRHPSSSHRFCLEGQFLGFLDDPKHPFKWIRLATVYGEIEMKLDKSLRLMVLYRFSPGNYLRVTGWQRYKGDGTLRFKAEEILRVPDGSQDSEPLVQSSIGPVGIGCESSIGCAGELKSPATILVCNESKCRKRGGAAICQLLQSLLPDAQAVPVRVKTTGCMGRCKGAPNLVMPGKTRYERVAPSQIPALLEAHGLRVEAPSKMP